MRLLFSNKLTNLITFALMNLVGWIKNCAEKTEKPDHHDIISFIQSSNEKTPTVNFNKKKKRLVKKHKR